jgi:multisubunit Na+/H+ antiporter MnhB subunit
MQRFTLSTILHAMAFRAPPSRTRVGAAKNRLLMRLPAWAGAGLASAVFGVGLAGFLAAMRSDVRLLLLAPAIFVVCWVAMLAMWTRRGYSVTDPPPPELDPDRA